jgi:hypothetical protein
MIFHTKYKIENLFCPRCESCLYRSTYFEHYPEYPYGCLKCDELIAESEAKKVSFENADARDSGSANG